MPVSRRTILPVVGTVAVAAAAGAAAWRFLGHPAPAAAAQNSTPVPATAPAASAPAAPPVAGSGPQYGQRSIGSPTAPVTAHEYFSLTCTHCAHFGTVTMPQVKPNLVDTGKLQIIYHDFPLDQVALKAAKVARYLPAAQYYPFIEALFASQDDWAFQPGEDYHASIFKYAALAGMDQATYEAAWNDAALEQYILSTQAADEKMYNITATPTFIINGKTYPGAMEYDAFAATVAQAAGG